MKTAIRLAVRSIRRQPVVCAAVIAVLAISIGVHTAIFSLIHAALLQPLPYQEAERMVVIESVSTKTGGSYGLSVADGDDYLRTSKTLETLGSFESRRDNLVLDGGTVLSVPSAVVTSGVLAATGVRPMLGRLFEAENDDRQGAASFKTVLSHALWRSHFGADQEILGKRVETSLGTYTVIGVLPIGFGFPDATQIWFPYQNWIDTQDISDTRADQRSSRWSEGIGRLADGSTLEDARAEMTSLAEALASEYPETNELWRPRLTPYREAKTGDLRPHLRSLFVLSWVFLALAVITLASLQTARGVARARHFGIQRALGAQPLRVAAQLLLETLMLAVLGGALGVLFAFLLLSALPDLVAQTLPAWIDPQIGLAEIGLAALVVLGIAVLAGIAPLGVALRGNLRGLVGAGGGSGGGVRFGNLRRLLVVTEVALTTVLLVGALLLSASFRNLARQDPGFDPEDVLVIELSPQFEGDYYEQTDQLARFYQRIQVALESIPGVVSVGGATNLPYLGSTRRPVTLLARGGASEEEQEHQAPIMTIDQSPGYFDALGIELLEGRDLAWSDERERGMVIVLSRRAAETLFPGRSAIGQEVRITGDDWARVVGVVADVRYDPRETEFGAELYYPITQYKAWRQSVVVRTRSDGLAMAPQLRSKLSEVAPETGVVEIRALHDIMQGSLWQARLLGTLGPLFAIVSLLLALLGVYGLLDSEFGARRRELGLRAALGAPLVSLGRLVAMYGLGLVGLGTILGVTGAFLFGPALAASLFGVEARSPLIYVLACSVLLASGALACFLPALRAMRIDPSEALREE